MALLKGEEKQKHFFFSLRFLTKRFNGGGGEKELKKEKEQRFAE